jgi:AcrR family transcriptional regulator
VRKAKARGPREPLSRERIVERAFALIEGEGLEAFSIRGLAGALGCEAMSIYHYFPSKVALFDAMLDKMVSEADLGADDLPWIERLRGAAQAYRAIAHRYPHFFRYAVVHRMNTRTGLAFIERILAIFVDAGFDLEATARYFRAFSYYVSGAALDEAAGYGRGPSAAEPVPDEEARRDFPLVAAVNPYFKPGSYERTFEVGLDMLLAGIAAAAPKRPPRPAKAQRRRAASASAI